MTLVTTTTPFFTHNCKACNNKVVLSPFTFQQRFAFIAN